MAGQQQTDRLVCEKCQEEEPVELWGVRGTKTHDEGKDEGGSNRITEPGWENCCYLPAFIGYDY